MQITMSLLLMIHKTPITTHPYKMMKVPAMGRIMKQLMKLMKIPAYTKKDEKAMKRSDRGNPIVQRH